MRSYGICATIAVTSVLLLSSSISHAQPRQNNRGTTLYAQRTTPRTAGHGNTNSSQNGDSESIIRPGTHPGFIGGGLGFSAGAGVAFNLTAMGGYHFFGNSSGPVLSGEFELRIGGAVGLLPGVRFGWDIPIANIGLYLSPNIRLGAQIFPDIAGMVVAHFDIQPAFDVKLVLGDRGFVFARPVGVDILINDLGAGATYQLLLGGGVTL